MISFSYQMDEFQWGPNDCSVIPTTLISNHLWYRNNINTVLSKWYHWADIRYLGNIEAIVTSRYHFSIKWTNFNEVPVIAQWYLPHWYLCLGAIMMFGDVLSTLEGNLTWYWRKHCRAQPELIQRHLPANNKAMSCCGHNVLSGDHST